MRARILWNLSNAIVTMIRSNWTKKTYLLVMKRVTGPVNQYDIILHICTHSRLENRPIFIVYFIMNFGLIFKRPVELFSTNDPIYVRGVCICF